MLSVRDPLFLDRENTPSINLVLRATDRGDSPRASTLNIVVVLDDINDNTPVFRPASYAATVVEVCMCVHAYMCTYFRFALIFM